jgi:hypothetical protein
LASLDVTMFIEFQPPHDSEWGLGHLLPRSLKFCYYCLITTAFCCNILVVAQTTMLSVLGTGLALRGPDGSMITATDGLYTERKPIYLAFGVGLATTIGSVLVVVWLILSPEAAVVCMFITVLTCMRLYRSYLRIQETFEFDENETVDFTDIFTNLPAAGSRNSSLAGTAGRRRQHDEKQKKSDGTINNIGFEQSTRSRYSSSQHRHARHQNHDREHNGYRSRQRGTTNRRDQHQSRKSVSSCENESDDPMESASFEDEYEYEMSSARGSPLMTV